jgi:mannose-6-phosphate isomerase-like protein (cupin superfamily)
MGTALLSLENLSPNKRPARVLRYQGCLLTIHADSADTAGQFALVEVEGGSGGEPPLHVHRNEDELFYVIEGAIKVFRGFEEFLVQPGQSCYLPRNMPHTFNIMSKHARALVYVTPGGFEGYFRDMGQSAEDIHDPEGPRPNASAAEMMRVAGLYGVSFLR